MSLFGQIPTHLVCRFSELTKTEIMVLCYLYAKRNLETRQCNPSKASVGRAIGIARPHVSRAIAGLVKHGWVEEDEDGFLLMDNPKKRTNLVTEKRTNSVTKRTNPDTPTVPISSQKRTKIDEKAYQNGDAYIRIKHTNNREENREEDAHEITAVSLYQEFYPEESPNIWQQECIAERVSDLERWHRALTVWKTNNWVGRNIANILDYYDKHTERDEKYGKPSTDYRQDREQQAINDRNFFDRLRAEIDLTDRQLQETDASGGSGQFRTLSSKPDDGRESLPC